MIKKEFQKNIIFVEHCINKFREELDRVDSFDRLKRATRKSKLNALRKQINEELLLIEKTYGGGIYDYERVDIEDD